MVETPDQIVEQIEVQRDRLSKHVAELESYVKEKVDMRAHYERWPWRFVGGAAAGGVLLALVTGRRSRRRY